MTSSTISTLLLLITSLTCLGAEKTAELIRGQIQACKVLLTPEGFGDSFGIPFSTNSVEDFRVQLNEAISLNGLEQFKNGTFFVLGTKMGDEKNLKQRFESVLRESGLFDLGARVRIMSVPSGLVEAESAGIVRRIFERLEYFFPSISRDYQKPLASEVGGGFFTSAAIEVPTILFLHQTMPSPDFELTALTHIVLLGSYTVFSQSMLNWLFRSQMSSTKAQNVELFVKQMALSLPFVLNYQLFGHFGEIAAYLNSYGWNATLAAFPQELARFTVTQGLTLVLQTMFYSQVISKGFGGWINSQNTEYERESARALRPWLQAPVLIADAVILAMAASNTAPLLQIGLFEVNMGHVALASLTATGAYYFSNFSRQLNRTLPLAKFFGELRKKITSWKANP